MKSLKNALKIAGVYTGIVIGAGFASGREIASFFLVHGDKWLLSLCFSGVLFAFAGWAVMQIIYNEKIDSYGAFLSTIAPPIGALIIEIISGAFLCILYFTMAAASEALIIEAFEIKYGSCIMLALCFVVFMADEKGILTVSSILSPLLIISGTVVGIYTFSKSVSYGMIGNTTGWAASSLIYVSYNIITAITVLVNIRDVITSKKVIVISSVISALGLLILGIAVGGAMYKNGSVSGELPLLPIIDGSIIRKIYIFMLASAIFTTALGNGYGASKWLNEKTGVKYIYIAAILTVAAVFGSKIGFSSFVDRVYPIFGILSLVEIGYILTFLLKSSKL